MAHICGIGSLGLMLVMVEVSIALLCVTVSLRIVKRYK